MKKEKIISLLNEGLSLEEIPTITTLKEIENLVKKVNFDSETNDKITEGLKQLEVETIGHAEAFSLMLKKAAKMK